MMRITRLIAIVALLHAQAFAGVITPGGSSGGITNSAGNNVVMKSNATNAVASSITDDTTTVATSEPLKINTAGATNAGLTIIGTSAGGAGAQDFLLSQRGTAISFPVPYFQPIGNNEVLALDLFPKGSPTIGSGGYTWLDVCDADLPANSSVATHCARVGIGANAIIDSVSLNGASQLGTSLNVGGSAVLTALAASVSIVQPLALTPTSGTALAITENQNAGTVSTILNNNGSTASFTKFGTSNGTTVTELYTFGTGYTTNGALQQNSGVLYSSATNGINIASSGASTPIRFYTGGFAAANLALSITSNGNLLTTGTAPGAPTSCGTSPAYTANSPNTDTSSRVTTGTTNTGCTIPWAATKTKIPTCTCTDETNSARITSCVPSATNLVFTLSANSSDVISYICVGGAGGT